MGVAPLIITDDMKPAPVAGTAPENLFTDTPDFGGPFVLSKDSDNVMMTAFIYTVVVSLCFWYLVYFKKPTVPRPSVVTIDNANLMN